jgi:uncharacterized membrane protein YtjA (UPF0391 family)
MDWKREERPEPNEISKTGASLAPVLPVVKSGVPRNSAAQRRMLAKPFSPRSFPLNYSIIFLIIAIIAGALGIGVIAGTAATIAKVLFVIFLVLGVTSLLRGRTA